jgi:hypothetical protein
MKREPKKSSDRRGCPKGKGTIQGGPGVRSSGPTQKGRIGNPPFVATDEQRDKVVLLAAVGTLQRLIADELGISVDTLERHFRAELDEAAVRANAKVGKTLFEGAIEGDAKKIEMWLDRRGGPDWRKRTGLEHTGANGGPIEYRDLSDEEVEARINALLSGNATADRPTQH